MFRPVLCLLLLNLFVAGFRPAGQACAQDDAGMRLRSLQFQSVELNESSWAHWGDRPDRFSSWTNHSNRLIPVYAFGHSLDWIQGKHSVYRNESKIESLYGTLPKDTYNPEARYFDQTDVYRLNKRAIANGKKHVFLVVFDGMDWQTTQAAAIFRAGAVEYQTGKGTGLAFLDYEGGDAEFGFCVTSPHNGDTKFDVNAQVVTVPGENRRGGYSFQFGGTTPWQTQVDARYLLGKRNTLPHAYTDSASSATSLNAGVKTFNGSINVDPGGQAITPIAHELQKQGWAIGIVTSVPISHATPAAVYARNVNRSDYQDLTRDMVGLPSVYHRSKPLAGVDVLLGGGFGELSKDDRAKQGNNFIPGNKYFAQVDMEKIDVANGGKYVVAQRTAGRLGSEVLQQATQQAVKKDARLFGFFGVGGGHLPYATADGKYDPTRGVSTGERYSRQDVEENPTLAELTTAALQVLQENSTGFYLMVEAGDVDWANHNNNIDDAIGAVYCGEAAFRVITDWVEKNSNWDESCLIVTADHGHYFVLDDPRALTGDLAPLDQQTFLKKREAKNAEKQNQDSK